MGKWRQCGHRYWSAPAWGAIVTGHGQAEIAVHEDLVATAPGLPRFEVPLALDRILNPFLAIESILTATGTIHTSLMPLITCA